MRCWNGGKTLAGEPPQKLALVHVVLEGFAAVDEDDGNLVVILAAELLVGIYIYFAPEKSPSALQLDQAFLDDFAQVTALARIEQDLARLGHVG